MRRRSLLLTLAAVAAAASPAAAQHCWPASLALVVQDADGRVVAPSAVDSVVSWPTPPATGHAAMYVRRASRSLHGGVAGRDSANVHYWPGRGGCVVAMDSVRIVHAGHRMTLVPSLFVDTERTPGSAMFVIQTPPMASGRWRLKPDVFTRTVGGDPRIFRAADWVREEPTPGAR